MSVAAALLAGAVATMLLLRTTTAVLAHPTLQRENYRGHHLPTAAGILLVTAVIAVDVWKTGTRNRTSSGRCSTTLSRLTLSSTRLAQQRTRAGRGDVPTARANADHARLG